jgi:hypothetical protein
LQSYLNIGQWHSFGILIYRVAQAAASVILLLGQLGPARLLWFQFSKSNRKPMKPFD